MGATAGHSIVFSQWAALPCRREVWLHLTDQHYELLRPRGGRSPPCGVGCPGGCPCCRVDRIGLRPFPKQYSRVPQQPQKQEAGRKEQDGEANGCRPSQHPRRQDPLQGEAKRTATPFTPVATTGVPILLHPWQCPQTKRGHVRGKTCKWSVCGWCGDVLLCGFGVLGVVAAAIQGGLRVWGDRKDVGVVRRGVV